MEGILVPNGETPSDLSLVRDANGFIIDVVPVDEVAQSSDIFEEFMSHFGVKGMRWGVRRTEAQLARASGKKDDDENADNSSGGERNSHQSSRPRSPASLSDAQLQAAVNRMNMEQQYARLQPTPASQQAAKFISQMAVNVARTQLERQVNRQISTRLDALISNR